MKRRWWVAALPWTALVLIAAFSVWQAWRHREDRLRDQERVLEIEQARIRAEAAQKAAQDARRGRDEAEALARIAQGRSAALRADLERLRKRVKSATPPESLPEAMGQLADCRAHGDACEAKLDAEHETAVNLDLALSSCKAADSACQSRADALEEAWKLERRRSNAFASSQKRERRRKIVGYVGVGVAGVLSGIGIGVVAK